MYITTIFEKCQCLFHYFKHLNLKNDKIIYKMRTFIICHSLIILKGVQKE